MMSHDLLLSILSLDSYNRGYGTNLTDLGEEGALGNVTIRAFKDDEQEGWEEAGFYAIAYDVSGAGIAGLDGTVISYRGTNANWSTESFEAFRDSPGVRDAANGWIVGAGIPGGQADLALDFYNAVVGEGNNAFAADITTTGHSLGGGLAGYVAALYGRQGYLYDHMPFASAVDNAFESSLSPEGSGLLDLSFIDDRQELRERIYGLGPVVTPNSGDLEAFATTGEALTPFRAADIVLNPSENLLYGVSVDSIDSHGGVPRSPLDLHSQALLVNLIWARDNVGEIGTAWQLAAGDLWDAFFNEEVATGLIGELAKFKGPLGTDVSTLQSAIAYSALDSGERPFGDVAIRSMFNDASDLGRAVNALDFEGFNARGEIAHVLLEYAGLLALRDVQEDETPGGVDALNGVLSLLTDPADASVAAALRVSFTEDLWSIGGDFHRSAQKETLVEDLLRSAEAERASLDLFFSQNDVSGLDDLKRWYTQEAEPGGDLINDVDEVIFSLRPEQLFQSADNVTNLSLQVGTNDAENISFDNGANHFLILGQGDDTATGSSGIDILYGGLGEDNLTGGEGRDFLSGGEDDDELQGGNENDRLDGGQGEDTVLGGDGDDQIVANRDDIADSYDGGDDQDTIIFKWNEGRGAILLPGPDVGIDSPGASFGLSISFVDSDFGFGEDVISSIELAAVEAGNDLDVLIIPDASVFDNVIEYIDLGGADSASQDIIDLRDFTDSRGLIVNLAENLVSVKMPGANESDLVVRNAETVLGSGNDDTLIGDVKRNLLQGFEGADELSGLGGNDILIGGGGEDNLLGGGGSDILFGNVTNDQNSNDIAKDVLDGGVAADYLFVNGGDEIVGIDGFDFVTFNGHFLTGGSYDEEDDVYIGTLGEEYSLVNDTLRVTFFDEEILIRDFSNGDGHINLTDADEESKPTKVFPNYFLNYDPLVLDLNLGGAELTSIAGSTTFFDLNNNGFAERTGWVQAGDGLLALDVNGDGVINGGAELFGNATTNGFTILAQYDENGDGQINADDAIWDRLLIWRDINLDGLSAGGELTAISAEDIAAINLENEAPRFSDEETRAGNSILGIGSFTRASDGADREAIAVGFTTNQTQTRFILPDDFRYDPEVFTLPNLRGSGEVPDLWVAMSLDPVLRQMVQDFVAGEYTSIEGLTGRPFIIDPPAYRQPVYAGGNSGPRRVVLGYRVFDPPPTYHYETSAFEDILARWAGVPISEGSSNQAQAEATAEAFLGREILNGDGTRRGTNRGAGNPNFHAAFLLFSTELATRFVVGLADIEQNRAELDLFSDILQVSGDGTVAPDPDALQQLIDNAAVGAEEQPELSPFLQRYAALDYDFGSDTVSGDVAGFIDSELQSFDFNPDNPWDGYNEWFAGRSRVLRVVEDGLAILQERQRAYTGNQLLPVLRGLHNRVEGDDGDNLLEGNAFPAATFNNLMIGGAGDDILLGGAGDDTYVFSDGSGADTVVDSVGRDEVAFQGSLTSDLAQFELQGSGGRDLRISFAGRDETVLIRGYLSRFNIPTIETISFANGILLDERVIRDLIIANQVTDGDDSITGSSLDETINGGAGDDTLIGFSDDDLLLTFRNRSRVALQGDEFAGGAGDDFISGSLGDDIYHFARGDGNDIIDIDGGGDQFISDAIISANVIAPANRRGDRIVFAEGIAPEDVTIRQLANRAGVEIAIAGGGDSITLAPAILDGEASPTVFVDIEFFDGTLWRAADIEQAIFDGSDADDIIFGLPNESNILSGQGGDDQIDGGEQEDLLTGGDGEDSINGSFGEDILRGEQGNDRLWGGAGADVLEGGAGNDDLRGEAGSDILVGGTGDDVLEGGSGDDIFRFSAGDGHDVVRPSTGEDIYEFAAGIAFDELVVEISADNRDVIVRAGDGSQSITFEEAANFPELSNHILRFADGDEHTIADLISDTLVTSDGADLLLGSYVDTTILGGAGDDEIRGGRGNEIIEGGLGNDLLSGGRGDDLFRFNLGDGQDHIVADQSVSLSLRGMDALEFGIGVTPDDISVVSSADGTALILSITGTDDQITIDRDAPLLSQGGEFRFVDGTIWSPSVLFQDSLGATLDDDILFALPGGSSLEGLDGNDQLSGSDASDILDGGPGADILSGGGGIDIYRFALGDGQDTIFDEAEFLPKLAQIIDEQGEVIDSARTDDPFLVYSLLNQNGVTGSLSELDSLTGDGLFPQDTITVTVDDNLVITDAELSFGGFTGPLELGNLIEFDEFIDPSDVVITVENGSSDHVVRIRDSDTAITITDQSAAGLSVVDAISFANGTVWNVNDINARTVMVEGDSLIGTFGADDLDPFGFFQSVIGSGGADRIIYERGYGDVTIDQLHIDGADFEDSRLVFGEGITASDVRVDWNEAGDIVLSLNEEDSVTLLRARIDAPGLSSRGATAFSGVYQVEFSDGTIWNPEELRAQLFVGRDDRDAIEGDAIGGIFDTLGITSEVTVRGQFDTVLYNQGYGPLTLTVDALFSDGLGPIGGIPTGAGGIAGDPGAIPPEAGSPVSPGFGLGRTILFGPNLNFGDAAISVTEDRSLVIDFGNGDRVEIVEALNSSAVASQNGEIDSFQSRDINFFLFADGLAVPFFAILIEANAQAVSNAETGDLTFEGTISSEFFDGQGLVRHINTGGGTDRVLYDKGYGPLTVNVAASFSPNNFTSFVFGENVDQNAIRILERQGGFFVDLGDGDEITINIQALDKGDGSPLVEPGIFFEFAQGTSVLEPEQIRALAEGNNAPTILGDVPSVMLSEPEGEDASSIVATGKIGFADANVGDAHNVSVSNITASGSTAGLPNIEDLSSLFSADIADVAFANSEGEIRWFFVGDQDLFSYLGDGEIVTLTYEISLDDGRGAVTTSIVSLNIAGANDTPILDSGAETVTLGIAEAAGTFEGIIEFNDSDLTDSHTASIRSVSVNGNADLLPDLSVVEDWLSLEPILSDASSSQNTFGWQFNSAGFDFDVLGQDGSATISYEVEISDGNGGTVVRPINISIGDVQSAPGVLFGLNNLIQLEDIAISLAIPDNAFSSILDGDIQLTARLSDGNDLPEWLNFDGGNFTGTPPENFNGDLQIRITASNGSTAASDIFTLVIEPVDDVPTIQAVIRDQSFEAETPIDVILPTDAFFDADGDDLILTASTADGSALPDWLEFNGFQFTGTPPSGFVGSIDIRVAASDGSLATDQIFRLAIGMDNNAPSAVIELLELRFDEDDFIDIEIPENSFEDIDGDLLTLTARLADGSNLPAWLIFNGSNITGTPPANFSGDLDIAITASDGELDTTQTFRLAILPASDAPEVSLSLIDVNSAEDNSIAITLPDGVFSDADGDPLSLTAMLADGSALPDWLLFDGSTFNGTPPQDFNGSLEIRVTATDGTLDVSDDFTLTIDPVNDAPVVLSPLADQNVDEDTAIDIPLPSGLFGDVDGDVISVSAALTDGSPLPSWLGFDGVRFTGIPPQDFNGILNIEVTGSDGVLSVADQLTLTIDPVNDAPVLVAAVEDQTANGNTSIDFAIEGSSFTDVDGDVLTISAELADGSALPAWLSFDAETLTFSGTAPSVSDVFDIRVTASDGLASASDDFLLTIEAEQTGGGNSEGFTLSNLNSWYNPAWGGGYNVTFEYEVQSDAIIDGELSAWDILGSYSGPGDITHGWVSGFPGASSFNFDGDGIQFSNVTQGYQPDLRAGDTFTISLQVNNAPYNDGDFVFEFYDRDPALNLADRNDTQLSVSPTNDWGSGLTQNVSVANIGADRIDDWQVVLERPDVNEFNITNVWNATVTELPNGDFLFEAAFYNEEIAPGGQANFGFNASYSGGDGVSFDSSSFYFLNDDQASQSAMSGEPNTLDSSAGDSLAPTEAEMARLLSVISQDLASFASPSSVETGQQINGMLQPLDFYA